MFLTSVCGVTATAQQIESARTQTTRSGGYPGSMPGAVGQMEINNWAHTTVFGANMTAITFIGQTCDVQSFKESMPPEKDIPVASAVTA